MFIVIGDISTREIVAFAGSVGCSCFVLRVVATLFGVCVFWLELPWDRVFNFASLSYCTVVCVMAGGEDRTVGSVLPCWVSQLVFLSRMAGLAPIHLGRPA